MKKFWLAIPLAVASSSAFANDWEKFFQSIGNIDATMPSSVAPEIIPTSSNREADMEAMWRKGFAAVGITSFNTGNDRTEDGVRLAKKSCLSG